MRRSKQEITDKTEIEEIIRNAVTARLGLNRDGAPYIVPMNFGYEDGTFFFHCAAEGLKLELLKKDPRVCVEIDEASGLIKNSADKPCDWGISYRSVIATGTAKVLDEADAKKHGLQIILRQFEKGAIPEMSESSIAATVVFAVRAETLTAKKSK